MPIFTDAEMARLCWVAEMAEAAGFVYRPQRIGQAERERRASLSREIRRLILDEHVFPADVLERCMG